MAVLVVIKNGRVERKDANTGSSKGSVGDSGAISASTDGKYIAVVYGNGTAKRYDENGSCKGSVGDSNAVSCQVSGGVVVITYKNGQSKRYDAITGSCKGSC